MKTIAPPLALGLVYLSMGFSRTSFSVGYSPRQLFLITFWNWRYNLKPSMKFNNPLSRFSPQEKLFWYLTLTAIATIAGYNIAYNHNLKKVMMANQEQFEDTSATKVPIQEDSIHLATGKISYSTFETDYSAESWYRKYKENPIAFNDEYDKKKIDLHGTITDISLSFSGYSVVTLGYENEVAVSIICNNVRNEKDMWRDEVKLLRTGQEVHIRGFFWKSELDSDNFHLEKCHVIIDTL